jgi:hypothetical protein
MNRPAIPKFSVQPEKHTLLSRLILTRVCAEYTCACESVRARQNAMKLLRRPQLYF